MKILVAIIIFFSLVTFTSAQQKTIDSLQKELSVSKADTNRVLLLSELARIYYLFKPDTALILAQQAYTLSQQLNYIKGEALALNRIAVSYSVVGDNPKALQFFMQALDMYRSIGDEEGVVRSTNNIGGSYAAQNDFKKALEYYIQAKNTSAIINNNYFETTTSLNLGDCYLNLKHPDSALKYLEQYYPVAKQNRYEDLYGDFERLLGNVKMMNNRYDEALTYLNKSIESYELEDDKLHLSVTYLDIANFYQKNNQHDSVITYAKKSLLTAQLVSYDYGILDASQLLSKFYEGSNNEEALRYFKIATAAKDSLFSQEKVKQMLSLSFEEKQRQQEIENAKLNYKNQVKLYVLGGVLIMFLVIATILFKNNRQKQKAFTLLQQQKKETDLALKELEQTQAQLIQSEKMASLGELTAGIAHEIQNPLNFVNNFSEVNKELIEELKIKNEKLKIEDDEINDLLNDLADNEEKINHHGKRAEAIVKGMLQHSRTSSGQKEPTDINKLVDEYLRLSYHGLRAKDKSFNADFKTDFDESLFADEAGIGKINIVPQDIGRVLLNLFNNAFYAVNEKKNTANENYQPTISVQTKKINDKIEISVEDNGNGIPQNIIDKIFQPFFTTKPTGSGTGLGLSLSYDIVKAHGGEIKVETKEGEGSEFIIQLSLKT